MLSLGARCSLHSCNTVDFLPILCQCDNYYCREHIQPDSHTCQVQANIISTNVTQDSTTKLIRCDQKECKKPSLEAFLAGHSDLVGPNRVRSVCDVCQMSFCAEHRHPKSHSCSAPLSLEPSKNSAAHALLNKHFPTSSATNMPTTKRAATHKIPADPAKLAKFKQVELMKLKHQAKPGDSAKQSGDIPVGHRLHLKISIDTSAKQMGEKPFWFVKTISVGKALDCLIKQFSLPQPTPSQPLRLYHIPFTNPDDRIELASDQLLSSLVEDTSRLIVLEPSRLLPVDPN